MRKWHGEPGFSLIEVSLALIIVGILLTFTFKTSSIIESVRLRSVAKAVETYRIATDLFVDKYGDLPGDYASAQVTINPSSRNGNGNGRVEGEGMDPRSEAFWFWQHLGDAGCIPHPGRLREGEAVTFGHGLPKSKMGGGFTVVQDPRGRTAMRGLWVLLGNAHGMRGSGAILTPMQAQGILDIFGERDVREGAVRVEEGTDVTPGSWMGDGRLMLQNSEPACIMYFKL